MSTALDYRSWQWSGKSESPRGISRRQKRSEGITYQDEALERLKQEYVECEFKSICTFKEFVRMKGLK